MICGALWLVYALIKKPHQVAILLFTAVIADINFDLPGMPLNFRAFLSLALFGRVMTMVKLRDPSFLNTAFCRYIIVFVVYVLYITFSNGLLTFSYVKEFILAIVCGYLGFYYFFKEGGYRLFKTALIISGFICVGDLAWTYVQGGGLWIQRMHFSFTPAFAVVNHNFFGYICAVGFVFLLADYLTDSENKYNLYFMPVLFFGVLLSTSRSSLLILILISVFLLGKALMKKKNNKKATKLIVLSFTCLLLMIFMFQFISVFGISSEFIEQITARMIDEPLAILNRALGNSYNVYSLDSMDWRAEASEIAMKRFQELDTYEKVFGIGHEGFLARNMGYFGIYDAHNGILLMLIENGIVGFTMYYLMLLYFFYSFYRLKIFSPTLVCMVYILMYITSHNRELISFFVFLILGTMAAEIKFRNQKQPVKEEDELPGLAPELQPG
jgi:hypothetical protein